MKGKYVNEFQVGDGISLYGYEGVVSEVDHKIIDETPCTYLKVNFNDPKNVGYQYEGGWYGGSDNRVAYGYIETR